MDFLLKETHGVVSDLFELCEGIQKQMNSFPDTLRKIKKQIKSYLLTNGSIPNSNNPKVKQDRKSTMDNLSASTSQTPGGQLRSQVRLLSQSMNDTKKKAESISDLEAVSKDNTQDVQMSEKTTSLVTKLLDDLIIIEEIIQKTIKNFKGDPIEYLGQSNPILVAIDDILAQIVTVKQEVESSYYQRIQALIDELSNYYLTEREKVVKIFEKNLTNELIQKQDPQEIEQLVHNLFKDEMVSISAPFIEESLVTQRNFGKFIQTNKDYDIQRIAIELIQQCQKNLMIYLMNKFLLNNHIKPSIVIRVKELFKEKKTFTYYLITPTSDTESLVNLDEYSFDSDNSHFVKEGDVQSTIKLDQYISHVFSSLLTVPLESFLPNYAVDHEGNLFRVFNHIQSKDGRTNHSGKFIQLSEIFFLMQRNQLTFSFVCLTSDKEMKINKKKVIELGNLYFSNIFLFLIQENFR